MNPVPIQPRPDERPVMFQEWRDLLFLHWDWDAEDVQRSLPAGLEVETWGGRAYVGLVPFFMCRVRPAGLPALPWLSDFLEMNVRTYVRDAAGRSGVWFYSLDCSQPVAVKIAQWVFRLPYFDAAMRAEQRLVGWDYACRRRGTRETAELAFGSRGPFGPAAQGSAEEFLLERYRLFAPKRRGLLSGLVWHAPYRFAESVCVGDFAAPLRQAGFDPCGRPPIHSVFSPGVRVAIYAPR